jgi:large subunit ribosomal protein L20
MPRVKRGKVATQKRERLLRRVKGFKWGRKSKERLAKEALLHAGKHAFRERKRRKREFRKLWQIKINAASRAHGLTYSKFMHKLRLANIRLDRKTLANLAENEPDVFEKIVEEVVRSV